MHNIHNQDYVSRYLINYKLSNYMMFLLFYPIEHFIRYIFFKSIFHT